MMSESPIRISAGRSAWTSPVASKTARRNATAAVTSRTTMRGVTVWKPAGGSRSSPMPKYRASIAGARCSRDRRPRVGRRHRRGAESAAWRSVRVHGPSHRSRRETSSGERLSKKDQTTSSAAFSEVSATHSMAVRQRNRAGRQRSSRAVGPLRGQPAPRSGVTNGSVLPGRPLPSLVQSLRHWENRVPARGGRRGRRMS